MKSFQEFNNDTKSTNEAVASGSNVDNEIIALKTALKNLKDKEKDIPFMKDASFDGSVNKKAVAVRKKGLKALTKLANTLAKEIKKLAKDIQKSAVDKKLLG